MISWKKNLSSIVDRIWIKTYSQVFVATYSLTVIRSHHIILFILTIYLTFFKRFEHLLNTRSIWKKVSCHPFIFKWYQQIRILFHCFDIWIKTYSHFCLAMIRKLSYFLYKYILKSKNLNLQCIDIRGSVRLLLMQHY